jgi:hypothetical protein
MVLKYHNELIGASSLLPTDAPDDAATRLDLVMAAFTRSTVVENEAQQRTMLRLSLAVDPVKRAQLPLRQGRAIKWIEEALAPLRKQMSEAEVHRLTLAIRSATGIEAFVWLNDVAGLPRNDAIKLMHWSAGALLRSAIAEKVSQKRRKAR